MNEATILWLGCMALGVYFGALGLVALTGLLEFPPAAIIVCFVLAGMILYRGADCLRRGNESWVHLARYLFGGNK